MPKVTGKLQITLPKRLAETYGIRVGDEVEIVPAGDAISIIPANRRPRRRLSVEERLRLFDESMRRQRERDSRHVPASTEDRGWRREDLYDRHRPKT
jgi:AbrB family looped-hinge helix DNA binding protein